MTDFSFSFYKKILQYHKSRLVSFSRARTAKKFTVIRHDVEFSVLSALEMAKIEAELDVQSTFLFQTHCGAYNIFNPKVRAIIDKIGSMGHTIGLHAYVDKQSKPNKETLEAAVYQQKCLLEVALDHTCEIFSFHRPSETVLSLSEDIQCEMINAYGPSFFEFSKNPTNIRYISDSRHRFNYGCPLSVEKFDKIQLLIHPDEWSSTGFNVKDNFKRLHKELTNELIYIFENETDYFQKAWLE